MKIHQLVAGFRGGDAISNTAVLMRDVFRSWGCESDIFCPHSCVAPYSRKHVRELATLEADLNPKDIAILHLSIGCEANKVFPNLRCKKVIVYHNITPSRFFRLVSPSTAAVLDEGRNELKRLAGAADINLADSPFNASELAEAGYKDPKVLPLPIDLSSFTPGKCDLRSLNYDALDGHFNIVFVGRFAPNKKIEDLVNVLFYLTKIEPRARLIHVGAISGMESYCAIVMAHASQLGLTNAYFMGPQSDAYLNACYSTAHAFLCMSEHEGFCAPLVEAMLYRIPVFARAAAAVPQTLGDAGVLFESPPDFPIIAETIAEVLHDQSLRDSILARQDKRIAEIRGRDLSGELKTLLASLL